MTNYPTIIQHTWIPLLKINISDWPHFRHRTWMPHYLTRKCGAGLLICIRGSGKTRKQINENSTPHLYRMSFAYGYMWQVLLLSPASILKFTRFLIQGVSETHQLYMLVVCTTLQRLAMFSDKQQGVLFILQKYMYRSKFPIWFLTKILENCSLSFFMWFVGSFSDTSTEKRLRSFFGGGYGLATFPPLNRPVFV